MGYDAEKKVATGIAAVTPSSATPVPGKSTLVQASGAAPLPPEIRAKLEAAFGRNFAGVRIHQDGLAAANGAKALTRGNDIHFAPGQFDPGSPEGLELLAHELTHVVQQSHRGPTAE